MVLPAPDGPTTASRSRDFTVEGEIVERRRVAPRRIMEGDILERELAARGLGQPRGLGRRADVGLGVEQFGQPLGRAGGAQQVAIDFGQSAERAGEQSAVEHERGDRAAAHPAARRPRSRPAR